MKVLQINVCSGCYSTGKIASDIAKELDSQGVDNVIAYGRSYKDTGVKTIRIGNKIDYYVHAALSRVFDCSGFGSKKATIKFIEWVRKYDPDVIHLHNIHGYYINIEVLFDYLRTCGKKIIWTLHDCWAFTGHSALCDGINCERWEKGCYKCPNLKEYPKSFTDYSKINWLKKRKLFTKIPNLTIVTPSHWLAGLVKRSFLKAYPVIVIHNGIDTSQFYPMKSNFRKKYGIEDKFILLGVASSWYEMKGLSDYVKLANMLDDSYRVILVGIKKGQIKKVPSNMICIERTNSTKELACIYTAADLLLNLSYCENYPTVNLEAQACGTPVITYKTGGSIESVPFNNCIEQGDLENVLISILKNDYSVINSKILDCVESTSQYIAIYRRIIKQ